MFELLPTNILWREILANCVVDTEEIKIPVMRNLFESNEFPFFSEEEFSRIKNKMGTITDNIQAIKDENYNFKFKPDIIRQIMNYSDIEMFAPKFVISYMLNSYIAWTIDSIEKRNIDQFSLVLEALIFLIESENKYIKENAYHLAVSAFYNVFSYYVIEFSDVDYSDNLNLLVEFYKIVPNLPLNVYDIIIKLAGTLIDPNSKEITKNGGELLNVCGNLIKTTPNFPENIIVSLQLLIEKAFLSLDKTVIDFYTKFFNSINESALVNSVSKFNQSIPELLHERTVTIHYETKSPPSNIDTKSQSVSYEMETVPFKTFDSKMEIKEPPVFNQDYKLINLLPEDITSLLRQLSVILLQKDFIVQTFLTPWLYTIYLPNNDEHFYDLIAVIMILLEIFGDKTDISVVMQQLLISAVFDDRITCFNCEGHTEEEEKMHAIREFILNYVLTKEKYMDYKFLDDFLQNPLCYAEVIYTLVSPKFIERNSKNLGLKIMNHNLLYQMTCKTANDEERKRICVARTSIFYALSKLLENEENRECLLSNRLFLCSIRKCLFEDPCRWYALDLVHKYCDYNLVTETIEELFSIIFIQPIGTKKVNLMVDFVDLATFFVKKDKKDKVTAFFKSLFNNVKQMKKEEDLNKLIVALVHLSCALSRKKIKRFIYKYLVSIIADMYNEPDEELLISMTSIAAGKEIQSYDEIEEFLHPTFLIAILDIFAGSNNYDIFLDRIIYFCDRKLEFCSQFRDCSLDIELLDVVGRWIKKEREGMSELVKKTLQAFIAIETGGSTTSAVYKFVSLMCPVDCKRHAIYFDEIFTFFESFVKKSFQEPGANIPISTKTVQFIYGCNDFAISQGFSFAIWLKVEELKSYFKIFTLTDTLGDHLQIYYKNGSFFVQNKEDECKIDMDIKKNKWAHLTFSFIFDIDSTTVTTYLNGVKDETERKMGSYKPEKGQLDMAIGNNIYDASIDDNCASYGRCGMFTVLTDEEVLEVYNKGSRVETSTIKAFFNLEPVILENKMKLTGYLKKELSLKEVQLEPTRQHGFALTLTAVSGLTFLLPLFDHAHLPPGPSVFSRVVDILLTLLRLGHEAELKFSKSCGFGMVSLFLTREETLTFELYQKFVDLLAFSVNKELQSQLGQYIIFRPDIWLKCSNSDIRKITNSWKELYATKKNKKAIFSLSNCVHSLRTHFFYDTEEKEIVQCSAVQRDKDLDIKGIREDILTIAYKIASYKMNNVQFSQIASQILSVANPDVAEELVILLKKIVSSLTQEVANTTSIFNTVGSLQYAIGTGTESLSIALIELLMLCYKKGVVRTVPYDQFTTIAFQLPPGFGTKKILDAILAADKINTLPLLFIIAYNCDCLDYLLDNIEPSVYNIIGWYIVPALVLFRAPRNVMKKGAKFLIRCARNVPLLVDKVDELGRLVTGHELFLHEMIEVLIELELDKEAKIQISNAICKSLLMRPVSKYSNNIKKLFAETFEDVKEELPKADKKSCTFEYANTVRSRFSCNTRPVRIRKNEENFMVSFSSYTSDVKYDEKSFRLDDFFRCLQRGYPQRCYGIQLDENGKWIDEEIVKRFSSELGPFICTTQGVFINHKDLKSFESFTESAFRIEETTAIESLNQFVEYSKKLTETAALHAVCSNEDPAAFSLRSAVKYIDSIENDKHLGSKMWSHLWKNLSYDHAPWAKSIDSNNQLMYKRDPILCFGMLPLKMKRNLRYSKHETASEARDNDAPINRDQEKKQADTINLRLRKKQSEEEEIECSLVNITNNVPALLTVTKDGISISTNDNPGKLVKYSNVYSIMLKLWNQKPTAIEIVTLDGVSFFINFNEGHALKFLQRFEAKRFGNARFVMQTSFRPFFKEQSFTRKWLNNTMSNFEYLMLLNNFAGRSFSSLTVYPYLPWILNDYSKPVDPTNPNCYRDLSKPLGNIKKDEQDLEESFNRLKQFGVSPFNFEYGPSNPHIISNLLVRMEPFATYHIQHGKRFDKSSNIFRSIPKLEIGGDYSECVPEFFFSPDFLVNSNNFNLGTVNGENIDNVELPPWADSPFDFIYKHRRLLESNYVRRHLHSWIDLHFGYKQKGEEAINSHNLYIPELYPEAWKNNKLDKNQIEMAQQNLGQIPQQLFKEPHPACHIKPIRQHEAIVDYKLTENNLMFAHSATKGNYTLFNCIDSTGKGKTVRMKPFDTDHEDILTEYLYTDKQPKLSCKHPLGFLYTIDGYNLFLFNIKKNESTHLYKHNFPITCMSCDNVYAVIGDSDSCLLLFKTVYMKEPRAVINCYRSAIKSVMVSSAMNSITATTKDDYVVMVSIKMKSIMASTRIKTGKALLNVTPTWGFAVICEENELHVLSINGVELKHHKLEKEAIAISSARTTDFFDIVAIADVDYNIYVFDAYVPESLVKAGSLPSKPLSLSISVEDMEISVICENGSCYFIPLPTEPLFPETLFNIKK